MELSPLVLARLFPTQLSSSLSLEFSLLLYPYPSTISWMNFSLAFLNSFPNALPLSSLSISSLSQPYFQQMISSLNVHRMGQMWWCWTDVANSLWYSLAYIFPFIKESSSSIIFCKTVYGMRLILELAQASPARTVLALRLRPRTSSMTSHAFSIFYTASSKMPTSWASSALPLTKSKSIQFQYCTMRWVYASSLIFLMSLLLCLISAVYFIYSSKIMQGESRQSYSRVGDGDSFCNTLLNYCSLSKQNCEQTDVVALELALTVIGMLGWMTMWLSFLLLCLRVQNSLRRAHATPMLPAAIHHFHSICLTLSIMIIFMMILIQF